MIWIGKLFNPRKNSPRVIENELPKDLEWIDRKKGHLVNVKTGKLIVMVNTNMTFNEYFKIGEYENRK